MGARIALAAPQPGYAVKLARYLKETEREWEVAAFTQEMALARYVQDVPPADMLLIHPDLYAQVKERLPTSMYVVLLLEEETAGSDDQTLPSVAQFQPMSRLAATLRALLEGGVRRQSRDGTAVWTVFSASGGVGKTTLALNLARQLNERGVRAFYLNLEPLNVTDQLFGRGEPDRLTSVLYTLQAHPEEGGRMLQQLAERSSPIGTGYMDAPEHPAERLALTAERLRMLLDALRGSARFDVIVVDPDSGCGEWHRALLEWSEEVLWLALDDVQSVRKAERLVKEWQGKVAGFPGKCTFALNRQEGAPGNDWRTPPGTTLHPLPEIPQWNRLSTMQTLLHSSAYSGAVDRLLDRLCPSRDDSAGHEKVPTGADRSWQP
ncbi:hypothetical protein [Cohnella sp. REN36]|uniref:AAA family ATPase n=1 Tax=Cohnella sp. REN36 TaxID=2887347 RepID=UPI001D14B0BC|nr:hypothetical protein [Cohnella sp. REN36]MCC3375518.1 hypothetical protein [Cohnella sp. REN36]